MGKVRRTKMRERVGDLSVYFRHKEGRNKWRKNLVPLPLTEEWIIDQRKRRQISKPSIREFSVSGRKCVI